jgi:hypothetical protein
VSELKVRESLRTLMDCYSPLPDIGHTQVSELKMRKSLTLMDCSTPSQIWATPR